MNTARVTRALIDRLGEHTGTGQPLDGVTVLYGLDLNKMTDRTIYAGGKDFDRPGDSDVFDGDQRGALEVDTVSLLIRVLGRGESLRDTEAAAEVIGEQLEAVIAAEPQMLGPGTDLRVAGGTSDYDLTDDGPLVILVYRVECNAYG